MSGAGNRFGSELPKQFHRIAGKKVYLYTVEQFLAVPAFTTILLVCPPSRLVQVQEEISAYNDPRLEVIAGGESRQESSFLGLKACEGKTNYVVVHDGVRPFVSAEILLDNIQGAIDAGAVDTCIPSADTIVHRGPGHNILDIPPRSEYWRGQTPQSFSYGLILKAHQEACRAGITAASDDCSLVVRLNHPVKIVPGSEDNIKITTELDLFLAEQILRLKTTQATTPAEHGEALKGKRIAVTGGTGGIGQEIVKQLAEAGAVPIVISRSAPNYRADLTVPEQVRDVFAKIDQDFGPLDGLINCFGKLHKEEISSLDPQEIEALIATNLTGVIYCCKWARLRPGSHIINIASSSYVRGKKDYAVYAGAKAAVVNFTQGLAEERPDLYINALIPQRTHTPMRLLHFSNEDISTLLNPDEVASTVLATLQNTALSGALIEVRKHFKIKESGII